ncbi:MAG: hypothetical protein PHT33_03060 [bacterium]|nr:hypothetical protein [bacterium]
MVFNEDFDKSSLVSPRFWASNCKDVKINAMEVSSEYAYSGRNSFKIDLTLNGGHYYYLSIPVVIPFQSPLDGRSANLKFSGRILVKQADGLSINGKGIQLGYGWSNPEIGASGCVSMGRKAKTEGDWVQWEAEAGHMSGMSDTAYMQHLAVYIVHKFENTHIVIYLDDFQVSGDLPADYAVTYDRYLKNKQREWYGSAKDYYSCVGGKVDNIPAADANLKEWHLEQYRLLKEYAAKTMAELKNLCSGLTEGSMTVSKLNEIRNKARYAEFAVDSCYALAGSGGFYKRVPYLIYKVQPTQNDRLLPQSFPIPGVVCRNLEIAACPGEYEPASFAVHTPVALEKLSVKVSDLYAGKTKLSASCLDVRVVKVWWQAGTAYTQIDQPTLAPELLLRDDDFVSVDYIDTAKHANVLKNPAAPVDAEYFRPVSIPGNTAKQFWLTAHIPEATRAGKYSGFVTIQGQNLPALQLPITVQVYPFKLEETNKEYMAYYTGSLTSASQRSIGYKEEVDTYAKQMRSLVQHGINVATLYCKIASTDKDGRLDLSRLKKELIVRREAGMKDVPIPCIGIPIDFMEAEPADEKVKMERIRYIKDIVGQLNAFCDENGFPRLAFYGVDEAFLRYDAEWMRKRIWVLRAILEAGGMTYCAEPPAYFPVAGDYYSRIVLAIHGGSVGKELIDEIHKRGFKALEYGRPQGCAEEPETFRRGYGVLIWKDNLDGATHWAWQEGLYRDFRAYDDDGPGNNRKFTMAYPTSDGVIDTIQYEGMREGIDDMRYIATLLKAIDSARKDTGKASLAADAEKFLNSVDVARCDLDDMRTQITQWIIRLTQPKKENR